MKNQDVMNIHVERIKHYTFSGYVDKYEKSTQSLLGNEWFDESGTAEVEGDYSVSWSAHNEPEIKIEFAYVFKGKDHIEIPLSSINIKQLEEEILEDGPIDLWIQDRDESFQEYEKYY